MKDHCGGGELYCTGGDQGTILQLLDAHAGIDYFINAPGGGYQGLAARVEYAGRNYGTFTIRYPSEWTGRNRDIKSQNYFPHLWVHGYTDGDTFQSAAIIKTQELYEVAHKLAADNKLTMKQHMGQKFYSIPWSETQAVIVQAP